MEVLATLHIIPDPESVISGQRWSMVFAVGHYYCGDYAADATNRYRLLITVSGDFCQTH